MLCGVINRQPFQTSDGKMGSGCKCYSFRAKVDCRLQLFRKQRSSAREISREDLDALVAIDIVAMTVPKTHSELPAATAGWRWR